MPIHDWTRVRAGTFHHFHQRWIGAICDALNTGVLPPEYFAMVEQRTGGPEPDVVALEMPSSTRPSNGDGGVAVQTAPPKTRFQMETDEDNYARRADRITVRHSDGDVVAVIELVSPGNKSSRNAVQEFVDKAVALMRARIHLLVIDLFPPNPRNPQGIHKEIWDRFVEEPFELPPDKPLTLVSYSAGPAKVAYIEPVAVGDVLPDMAVFLKPDRHVLCPLEATYRATWDLLPAPLRRQLEPPPG